MELLDLEVLTGPKTNYMINLERLITISPILDINVSLWIRLIKT